MKSMAQYPELAITGIGRSEKSCADVREKTGSDCIQCNLDDPGSVENALRSADTLVVLHSAVPKPAGKGANGMPTLAFSAGGEPEKVDWQTGKVLIDAAKRAGVKHVVYVSSMGGTMIDHFLNKIQT
eukprot:UN13527